MMGNKLYVLGLALTAVAASAYVIRHQSRRQEAQQQKDDLGTWEGEGGKPASSVARPAKRAE